MDENGFGTNEAHRHIPVLAREVLAWMPRLSNAVYVDCTVGYGEFAARLLSGATEDSRLIGIDQDPAALQAAGSKLKEFGSRVVLREGNFAALSVHLQGMGIDRVDGVVLDLGVNSPQLERSERGFSFSLAGPLDMRMSGSGERTAEVLVNYLPEGELADLIFRYGEERYARRIARGVVRAREHAPLRTTADLVEVIRRAVPPGYRHGRIHFATRAFQALRIAVNRELEALTDVLPQAVEALKPGGRLAVISFHSLEDRIVKHAFRERAEGQDRVVRLLTKKPVRASAEECARNPRARSAKLRVVERVA